MDLGRVSSEAQGSAWVLFCAIVESSVSPLRNRLALATLRRSGSVMCTYVKRIQSSGSGRSAGLNLDAKRRTVRSSLRACQLLMRYA